MRATVLLVAFGTTNALLVGSAARLQARRASPVQAGLFDTLAAAFSNEEFDDRSAKGSLTHLHAACCANERPCVDSSAHSACAHTP